MPNEPNPETGHMPLRLGLVLLLLCSGILTAAQDTWTGVERIVALGDVHGDYGQFVTLLRAAGVVDDSGNWTGGKTHLVQVGDVLDRGPESRRAMDLLISLEKQAPRSGGYVHSLIGNHEAMNISGDLRYTTPEEFAAFRNDDPHDMADTLYQQHIAEKKSSTSPEAAPRFDDEYRKNWLSQFPPGYFAHRYQFGPSGVYGKWIRGHNTIIKINDSLFLHGGIAPKYAAFMLARINSTIRGELDDPARLPGGMAQDDDGPLWFRGLALAGEGTLDAHVNAVLAKHGAARIVVGHTVTEGTVMPRFAGRVLLIDAGMTQYYGARQACLVIENGKPDTLHRGHKLELPTDGGPGLVRYLKEAAALDPAPSPLIQKIAELERRALTEGDEKQSARGDR